MDASRNTKTYWVIYVEVGRYGTTTKRRVFDTEAAARVAIEKNYDPTTEVYRVTEEKV